MEAFIEYIRKTDENASIIYIDFTDLDFEELKEYHKLHTYVKKHMLNRKRIIFL